MCHNFFDVRSANQADGAIKDSQEFNNLKVDGEVEVQSFFSRVPVATEPATRKTDIGSGRSPGMTGTSDNVVPVPAVDAGKGPRHAHFIFAAASRGEFPAGSHPRDLEAYEEEASYWKPFLPPLDDDVFSIVTHIARRLKFNLIEIAIDTNIEVLIERARADEKVVIIIIDPWTLLLPLRRHHANLRPGRPVQLAILVVWNHQDPQTSSQEQMLRSKLRSTFSNKVSNKPVNFDHEMVKSLETFNSALAAGAEAGAEQHFRGTWLRSIHFRGWALGDADRERGRSAMMSQQQGPRGTIVTFYSYKGGVGRSMALANVAWILASAGKKVLMIDWDLEAPGLHRYLAPFLIDPDLESTEGLIDLVQEFALEAKTPLAEGEPGSGDWLEPLADVSRYAIEVDWEFPDGGSLDFVPAGKQDSSYASRVNFFNWKNFYERLGGGSFFERLKAELKANYDFVLIDSRTGVSDTAGICTVHMPDVLVVCFTLNRQNIKGAAAVTSSVYSQRSRSDVKILPVPMRLELGGEGQAGAGPRILCATGSPRSLTIFPRRAGRTTGATLRSSMIPTTPTRRFSRRSATRPVSRSPSSHQSSEFLVTSQEARSGDLPSPRNNSAKRCSHDTPSASIAFGRSNRSFPAGRN